MTSRALRWRCTSRAGSTPDSIGHSQALSTWGDNEATVCASHLVLVLLRGWHGNEPCAT
uniref:Uncharacterized protein n=1 Tax=Anguilla anguilla TaxID=7936 RepID=A0A0E9T931_ANGAN